MKKMKLEDFALRITYIVDGSEVVVGEGDANVSVTKLLDNDRLVVTLNAAKKVRLVSARLVQSRALGDNERFFGGGYQSWTLTREYSPRDRQVGLRNLSNLPVVRTFAAAHGDYPGFLNARGLTEFTPVTLEPYISEKFHFPLLSAESVDKWENSFF